MRREHTFNIRQGDWTGHKTSVKWSNKVIDCLKYTLVWWFRRKSIGVAVSSYIIKIGGFYRIVTKCMRNDFKLATECTEARIGIQLMLGWGHNGLLSSVLPFGNKNHAKLQIAKYRSEVKPLVKGSVCFILKFALPAFSPPIPSEVEVSKQNTLWTFDPRNMFTPV